ncbi:hypothetical protein [Nonomuraea sp. NPDC023979]|uniref:hypothetical protein n=1 Tax=Nonomuraea sp. NPDC023979 TaxID=3154796 RepID=UPI00340008B6
MAEHDNDFPSLGELAETLVGAYNLIGKLLGDLPIPIGLPPMPEREGGGREAAQALERARLALLDLPFDPETKSMFHTLLLEWLTAQDQMALAASVSADDHRLYALFATLTRISMIASMVEHRLTDPDS